MKFAVDEAVKEGAVGFKLMAAPVGRPAGDSDAKRIFAKYRFGGAGDGESSALATWLLHEILEEAGFEVLPAPIQFVQRGHLDYLLFDWLPSIDAFAATYAALHEYLGLVWYRLRY